MPAGPAAKGSAIACRGLSKSFGKIEALHDLTLTVPGGVTFGLLGPNGAGKTTSLRLWLGLTAPTAGKAQVLGESIPPRAVLPRIGYMPRDIAERREDMASTLSGGMRRRTSLAAALLHDPDLLLLDEPTVGVDPELRAAFWTFFRELTGRGKTVVKNAARSSG